MERGVNAVPGGQLKLVGDIVDLPHDLERTNVAGTSYRAGGDADHGWITTPGHQVDRWELGRVEHLHRSYVSALPVGDGRAQSPTLSRSPGTSSPQLEPPMALPTRRRAVVRNRVCTGRE